MAWLEKSLFVKRSKIPHSGKGLFTRARIEKGACIVEYKGRLSRWQDVKDQDGYNGYLLQVNNRWAIDALPFKRALGRFANDASGLQRVPGIVNNAEYLLHGTKCFIYATKAIQPGEEILVSYGRAYWNLIKKIKKLKAQ